MCLDNQNFPSQLLISIFPLFIFQKSNKEQKHCLSRWEGSANSIMHFPATAETHILAFFTLLVFTAGTSSFFLTAAQHGKSLWQEMESQSFFPKELPLKLLTKPSGAIKVKDETLWLSSWSRGMSVMPGYSESSKEGTVYKDKEEGCRGYM